MPNTPIDVPVIGTFAVFNQPSGPNDVAIWRLEDPALPPMYRPTIQMRAVPNKQGTNVNCNIKVSIPVVQTVGGITTSTNTIVGSATITSLQNITGDGVENVAKVLTAAITQQLSAITNGSSSI